MLVSETRPAGSLSFRGGDRRVFSGRILCLWGAGSKALRVLLCTWMLASPGAAQCGCPGWSPSVSTRGMGCGGAVELGGRGAGGLLSCRPPHAALLGLLPPRLLTVVLGSSMATKVTAPSRPAPRSGCLSSSPKVPSPSSLGGPGGGCVCVWGGCVTTVSLALFLRGALRSCRARGPHGRLAAGPVSWLSQPGKDRRGVDAPSAAALR